MKKYFNIWPIFTIPLCSIGQQSYSDSLRSELNSSTNDSVLYVTNMELGYYFSENNRDSSLVYYEKAYQLAIKRKKQLAESTGLSMLGYQNTMIGQYSKALKYLLDGFNKIEAGGKEENSWMFVPGFTGTPENYRDVVLSRHQALYSVLMRNTGNTEQEILYLKKSIITAKKIDYLWRIAVSDLNLSGVYLKLNILDSAIDFGNEGLKLIRQTNDRKYESALLIVLGDINFKRGNKVSALEYYLQAMMSARMTNATSHICWANFALCRYYLSEHNTDSSLYYAKNTLNTFLFSATPSHIFNISDVYENLFESYQLSYQFDSAYKYQGYTRITADSIYKDRINNLTAFQNLGFAEQLRLRDAEKEKLAYQSKIRTYALLAGIAVFMSIAFLLFTTSRRQKKDKIKIEQAYDNLKATQQQLIQSEKMASLGELTAGIAHEIQNPLNFVNNFSEVNGELIDEMQQEIDKGNYDDAKAISDDIKENEEKIKHHGRRADAIVKGMLQHSRSSSGIKEPTDINALADEYFRLAYHGLRAKDKSFNATMKTDFDESLSADEAGIGKINIIPQDIGRVILNLITNAFYVVTEKKKQGIEGYEPTVSVSTKKINSKVEIKVADNGNGIPAKVLDKIFQPFFTTKPTGQGTGLGLSLSYDIVKAHGGEIKVDTKEHEGTQFIIELPIV